jgi:uncharacterized membrane protein YfcA
MFIATIKPVFRGAVSGLLVGAILMGLFAPFMILLDWGFKLAETNSIGSSLFLVVAWASALFVGPVLPRMWLEMVPETVKRHAILPGALIGGFVAAFLATGLPTSSCLGCGLAGAVLGGTIGGWLQDRKDRHALPIARMAGLWVRNLMRYATR